MAPEEYQALLERVPFFRFLDFTVLEKDEQRIMASMPCKDRHIGNPVMKIFHGGIVASFMEAAASLGVSDDWVTNPPKPINLTVDYLRPAFARELFVQATITRKGKRMSSMETVAWQEDRDKPVAKGLYHFLHV